MHRSGHEHADFFVGTEVEHTPAYGKKTLFVVGLQDANRVVEILNQSNASNNSEDRIQHVYFGANMSFPKLSINDAVAWNSWYHMICSVMEKTDIMCTLDIDVSCAEGLAESGLCEHSNFIPMISVKMPYVRLLNYNTVVKIDDKDFKSTNPGVWTHSLHALMSREFFTDWSAYQNDQVL